MRPRRTASASARAEAPPPPPRSALRPRSARSASRGPSSTRMQSGRHPVRSRAALARRAQRRRRSGRRLGQSGARARGRVRRRRRPRRRPRPRRRCGRHRSMWGRGPRDHRRPRRGVASRTTRLAVRSSASVVNAEERSIETSNRYSIEKINCARYACEIVTLKFRNAARRARKPCPFSTSRVRIRHGRCAPGRLQEKYREVRRREGRARC